MALRPKLQRSADVSPQLSMADTPWIRQAAALKSKYKHRAYEGLVTIPWSDMGVHPFNRDGVKMQWRRIHELAEQIVNLGCDPEDPQGGTCVAETPGDDKIRKHNAHFVEGIPELPSSTLAIRFGSLEHSHFAYACRCIAGAVTSQSALLAVDGFMSLEVLERRDAAFAKLVRTGVRWFVLDPAINEGREACVIISAAANAKHTIGMREAEMSLIQRMSDICRASLQLGSEINKHTVLAKAMATKSCNLSEAEGLLEYVRCMAEQDGNVSHIDFLADFCTRCVNFNTRRVSGGFYKCVVENIPLTCPLLVNAILMVQYMNPAPGMVTWLLTSKDVVALGSNAAQCKVAQACLANALAEKPDDPIPLFAYFIRVAAFLCNKGQVFNHPLYRSLADIPLPGQDAKVRKDEAASSVDIVNRTQEGNVTNTKPRLLEAGIKEGVYITLKRKKTDHPGAYVESVGTKVRLRAPRTGGTDTFTCDEVLNDWCVAETPSWEKQGHILDWGKTLLPMNTTWTVEYCKQQISVCLDMLAHASKDNGAHGCEVLELRTKPRGCVHFKRGVQNTHSAASSFTRNLEYRCSA